ncbi:MAG: hypothetical protein COA67_00150 [Lutibacter sp.]|nr:MAG: hypothetical protein COA67_00150 [Lutibacter sp.]
MKKLFGFKKLQIYMKKNFTLLLLLISLHSFSQQDYAFGVLTQKEKEMVTYEKDTTANAVVLYEEANTEFFIYNDNSINIRTIVYRKIKIFNKEGFSNADVSITARIDDERKDRIKNIKGVTHNNGKTIFLKKENIYTAKAADDDTEITFTLPDIQQGSIIEYMYTRESPFLFNFTGWTFQNEIPTIESVFIAEVPGNFVYNRKLVGYQKLNRNESTIKKKCFNPGIMSDPINCEVMTYSMLDIPAFIEEDYLNSKWNYISRIDFEISEYRGFDGHNTKYSKTWKDVDKKFKNNKDIGGQLRKNTFFKNEIPEEIQSETDNMLRAKKIYLFVQDHFTWNEQYRMFDNINIVKAYKNRIGTISEINMSLINALNTSGINAKLVLLSTRKHGYPTTLYPVISDFNYIVAKVSIDGKNYFLDATNKNLPFGMLPYRCLNKQARVMDFKNGSYWEDIIPSNNNGRKVQMLLKLNEDQEFVGNMRIIHNGYSAIKKRNKLNLIEEKKYVENYEDENDYLEIISYKNLNLNDNEKPLKEELEISIENESTIADKIYLNPFFIDRLEENPFKLNQRQYPVNFGHPLKFDCISTIIFPENYTVESIPKSKIVKLPDNKGHFVYKVSTKNSKIMVNYSFNVNEVEFSGNDYLYLKEFFKQAIIAQNEPIILKKN